MNKNTEEHILMLLRTLANPQNWELHEVKDKYGDWLGSYYTWEKEFYDPMYVAQELLDEIGE
jgi:hypothetical protein